jgi:hypothetical protein
MPKRVNQQSHDLVYVLGDFSRLYGTDISAQISIDTF